MKHLIKRIVPGLLAAVLLAGAVPAYAAEDGTQFRDVSANAYYADAVEWAVTEGVTKGTSGSTFSPGSTVTRAQAVTFLWRAAGQPEPSASAPTFTDAANRNSYYYQAVRWAAEEGITNGVTATTFQPNGTLHYDQILAFLCRAAGGNATGSGWSQKAQTWAAANGITDGLTYAAKGNCPRSDAVYFLWQQLADPEEEQQAQQPVTPEKPEQVDAERPALPDEAGATLAIITGFLDKRSAIDISDFNLEASQAEALALEIADMDGKNPYGVTHVNAYEQDGKIAKTLAAYYTTSTVTVVVNDWRVISDEAQAEADRVVSQIITSGMSDYDIAKALHDYLILNCDYDKRLYSGNMPYTSYTAEGALLEGAAVCAGYSKAYEALLDAAGIPNETVTGYAGGYHAWNLVQIDGDWYHVDTTWDDPTNRGGDYIRYDYFLKSDAAIGKDHRNWDASHVCASTKHDNADLLDSAEQAKQEAEQAELDQILPICYAALEDLPYSTQAELQALDDNTLHDALYFYIDFSNSGIDASVLSMRYRDAGEAITQRDPDLQMRSFERSRMSYKLYRADVMAEIQRRQDAAKEQQAQQQAQNEADALKVEALLQEAIVGMDCGKMDITIEGYSPEVVKIACSNMNKSGYRFGDYTADDFRVSQKWNTTLVTITNNRWINAEIQKYVEQIEAALLQGETRIVLQPGSYPEYPDKPWYYASRARSIVAANGYTVGDLISGEDFVLQPGKINNNTMEFVIEVEYPVSDSSPEAGGQPTAQQEAEDAA